MPKSWLVRGAETSERNRRRMRLLGVTPNGYPLWSRLETGDLISGHPRYDLVMPLIPGRTRPAAYAKAGRLEITRPRHGWSDNEILRLRVFYPARTRDEILAAFPGRTYSAIAKAANKRGIYRVPKPKAPTGNEVLDQILARAMARNFTLSELDAVACSKGYFAGRLWKRGRFQHRVHGIVLSFLGGHLKARWLQD